MKKNYIFLILFAASATIFGQSVGINTANPHPSTMLDIKPNNGHISVTIPKVSLTTKSDQSVINGGTAAESLLVYNTNVNFPGRKGVYYWDPGSNEWQFLVTQGNIDLFRDLTKYYTLTSSSPVTINNTPSGDGTYALDSGISGWTMLKDDLNADIKAVVSAEQAVNFLEVNVTGTWIINSPSTTNASFDVAYGIFVDGKLKYTKTETRIAPTACSHANFYLNAAVQNISVGSHDVQIGVRLRRIRTTDSTNTSLPAGTTVKIGGGNTNCKNLNAFESQTRVTVYVNQTL